MELAGIDPATSRMLSERSTIWATTPLLLTIVNKWSWRVSIPLLPACKAGALPFELQPLMTIPGFDNQLQIVSSKNTPTGNWTRNTCLEGMYANHYTIGVLSLFLGNALAGNWTRVLRVAGEDYTTKPPVPSDDTRVRTWDLLRVRQTW